MGPEKTPEDLFYEGLLGNKLHQAVILPDPPVHSYEDLDNLEKLGQEPPTNVPEPSNPEKLRLLAFRQVTKSNLFSHPEAHPYVLDLALIKTFGLEWFHWEPETVFQEIRKTFNSSIADINRVKIMATMTLHIIDAAWEQWEIFENTVQALNGSIPRPFQMQPCDVPFLMAGVDIINDIRKEEFNDEVGRYIAACFRQDEISYAPPPLDFAQPFISEPRYLCKHCGKNGSALPPFNGRCDSCSFKFQDDHPFSFRGADWAKDDPDSVHYYLTYDFQETKKRFEELKDQPPDKLNISETPEDIEAAKLILANDYMDIRRKQKNQQLLDLQGWLVNS